MKYCARGVDIGCLNAFLDETIKEYDSFKTIEVKFFYEETFTSLTREERGVFCDKEKKN